MSRLLWFLARMWVVAALILCLPASAWCVMHLVGGTYWENIAAEWHEMIIPVWKGELMSCD